MENAQGDLERINLVQTGVGIGKPAQQQAYQQVNPLGGPAKVFDAMADSIRAGDDYYAVLRQYGYAEAQPDGCQCHACKITPHASDCAVHNEPAYPKGACNCGAQPEQEPVAIKWTLDGDKTCGYNNWLGKTPFGRILITWKGWKKYHDACVDEFPGDFHAYGLPDEVKELCEAEFAKRIGYTTSPQRKPLTDEQISNLWCEVSNTDFVTSDTHEFARAIEAAHGIKE